MNHVGWQPQTKLFQSSPRWMPHFQQGMCQSAISLDISAHWQRLWPTQTFTLCHGAYASIQLGKQFKSLAMSTGEWSDLNVFFSLPHPWVRILFWINNQEWCAAIS
jgi:hypothetical protein